MKTNTDVTILFNDSIPSQYWFILNNPIYWPKMDQFHFEKIF